MTRIDLQPLAGGALRVPRARALLRARKPLTRRELEAVFDRVRIRVQKAAEPFGIFAIKHGRGRVFKLISVKHADYAAQMRVDRAQQHMIGTYDRNADLGDIWDDLWSFDRVEGRG